MLLIAELRRPMAAKQSPYRTHAFIFFMVIIVSGIWLAGAYVHTTTSDYGVAQDGAHLVYLCMQLGLAIALILEIHFMINWQLSNQGIRWPVPHDHIAGSSQNSLRSCVFNKLTADQVIDFHWIRGQEFSQIIRASQKIGPQCVHVWLTIYWIKTEKKIVSWTYVVLSQS